jgi:integrase
VSFARSESAPFGTIRWRSENDKIENEHVVPMNGIAHDSLFRVARERQAIGAAWVFSSDMDESRPVDRHLASRWLRRAEKLAEIDHIKGRGWHSFRRGWASARKHLPDVDVAAAGGWKDTATMKRCYQHADPSGVLKAVTEPIRRVSG